MANSYDSYRNSSMPIVVDAGSHSLRAGWADQKLPPLIFDNIVAKHKDKKGTHHRILVGNNVHLAGLTGAAKSAFDGGVLVNSDLMEHTLDYIFLRLGIDTDRVHHPVLMTEPVCNPLHSRKLSSELLFEVYQAPSVSYGIDACFSYYNNQMPLGSSQGGFIVSANHNGTVLLPIWDSRCVVEHCRRISYGGLQSVDYMMKVLQMKFSSIPPVKISPADAESYVHNHCYVSLDYMNELRELSNPQSLAPKDIAIQFPYISKFGPTLTAEEQERAAQRRKEQGRRLQEQAAKNREEKLRKKEEYLEVLNALLQNPDNAELRSHGFESLAECEDVVKETEVAIKKARNKQLGIVEPPPERDEPVFLYLDVPDSELTEEQKKEKRKSRLLKAGHDARERARKDKEQERLREEELLRHEEEARNADFGKWLTELRAKRQLVVDKVRARQRKRAQLADRRSQASQMRMKNIASLASDEPTPKRRRKAQTEDTFGADDDDWGIYREIKGVEDEDEDEEDALLLSKYDGLLTTHDPEFVPEDIFGENKSPFANTLIDYLSHGVPTGRETEIEKEARDYQIHLNVERIRIPEVLFQPSIAGLDQAGVVEVLSDVIERFDQAAQIRMIENVFVTGGHSQYPNFTTRLYNEIRALCEPSQKVNIVLARDPLLDAWKGAAKYALAHRPSSDQPSSIWIQREQWDECGHDYLIEHALSNRYYGASILKRDTLF
ncbi:uncharacterized protein BJ171DRAFT_499916 [Polychytrium aggregatum]|uniref:uncharacterized protein n=1 Tax=Polychytrium aggregatum TaxID=110093 RepID=UPI0022FDB3FD|nr:uncharacterized protein BJ171DRAFT_499916 [Polychytrium aggregatum]KAI9205857.1 hypothetical protein BJ171DRAFT_499916 [Polychytrium aggregatum]